MTRIRERLNFFLSCCLLSQISSTTGTQKDVSHEWLNDFLLQLSSSKCQNYSVDINQQTQSMDTPFPWNTTIAMEGNTVNLTLTQCDGRHSPPVHLHLRQPELVTDLQCYRSSLRNAVCSWVPDARAEGLKFFYVFVNESDIEDESTFNELSFQVKECPLYSQAGGVRAACHLAYLGSHVLVSFRGRRRNVPSFNTFRRAVKSNVRPPALSWSVTEAADEFHIRWDNPDIDANWKIRIKYVVCGESKFLDKRGNSAVLNRASHCPYRLAIKATSSTGETPWSPYKSFRARADPLAYVYVAVFAPLVIVGLVAAAFVCFRRNKDAIFPKIPQPRNLLAGIPENNNKGTFNSNYHPSKEEVFRISLVTEPMYANMKPMKHPLL